VGCDIHVFLERKRSTEDTWSLDNCHTTDEDGLINTLCFNRWYKLFGRMASVRYHDSLCRPAAGIPKDASAAYLDVCDNWGIDGHSHSWMSISTYHKILKKLGYLKNIDVATFPNRYPVFNWRSVFSYTDDAAIFAIVLCYVHDAIEANNVNYLLTNDPYYLDEQFRLVFFFDS